MLMIRSYDVIFKLMAAVVIKPSTTEKTKTPVPQTKTEYKIGYRLSIVSPKTITITESKWAVFPKGIKVFPVSEAEMVELSEEEEYQLIFELRREKVNAVKLGNQSPHLHIVFDSGKTLFVNGHHDKYECWQARDGYGYTGDEWLIVATPGDSISTWAPNSFN
ncbi:hypothetical protein LOZ80_06210 [Paenibacillus sp. HWE-109]|uniref:hypothetical protein n=1 Tax=Paenibacillus sp. HWE-109 TaxID=1306526 RepID=UPI001EDF8970|nr:hypothetical protein [Paenibacillus sp. HWE-109]UKS28524.1 hypothetical protein LOZ80_06210 [Paenibacillus sp. HWE-109]